RLEVPLAEPREVMTYARRRVASGRTCVRGRGPVRVQAEGDLERAGALEPELLVLPVLGVRRPHERGDPEPARGVVEQAPEPRPDVVVEQPLDMAGGDRCSHGS